jgi:hypothetical protein
VNHRADQPDRASSTDEPQPDLRAIAAATTLQSRARDSSLASLARRQAIGSVTSIIARCERVIGKDAPQPRPLPNATQLA